VLDSNVDIHFQNPRNVSKSALARQYNLGFSSVQNSRSGDPFASPDNSVAVIPRGRRLIDEFLPEFLANYSEISSQDSVSEISSHR
jgi:hypothetical protein